MENKGDVTVSTTDHSARMLALISYSTGNKENLWIGSLYP